MAEFAFYHLTRTGPDRALPPLLGRTLEAGERAIVVCPTAARLAELDTWLWECPAPDWLPHGSARDGDADLQPIWLEEAAEAPVTPANGAAFLFLLDGATAPSELGYRRVFDLFDGRDEAAVAAARQRWVQSRAAGHALAYWQQGERGWERKR